MMPLRVLQVTSDLTLAMAGIYTTAKNFYHGLLRQGHEITSISFDHRHYDCSVREFAVQSIVSSRLPGLNKFSFSWAAAGGAHDALVERSDVLFLHALYRYHVNWAAQRVRPDQQVFVIPHGALCQFGLACRGNQKQLWLDSVRSFFAEHTSFIFSSALERDEALQTVSPWRSEVLRWPVAREFQLDPAPVGDGPRILLLSGRLHPHKRTLETISAFRRLDRLGWQLHVAGPPTAEIAVNDIRRAAGSAWEHSVIYRGALRAPELAAAYRSASGVVLFSHGENFANVIAEGVSNGCPAFVTDRVGLASDVREQGWGMVFDDGRITTAESQLEAAMEYCERDTEAARRRRLDQSREMFSMETFCRRLSEITSRWVLPCAA